MPKLKTHKGTKKVLKVRSGGTITKYAPGHRHNTGKKNAASNRVERKGTLLSKSDFKRIKEII